MAKLGSYYGLCPLIDHRSLLGICEDEEQGIVIVTLGKNIAIKFKLSDQKQLHSWRTKEKFTAPIVFDKEQGKYVAVFNQSYLRIWTGNEEFLDKLKKIKFNEQIHTIFNSQGKSFIVYRNGAVMSLKEAVENRKTLTLEPVISSLEHITEVLNASVGDGLYIGLFIQNTNETYLYWSKLSQLGQTKFSKIILKRPLNDITGYVFLADQNQVNFLSLWSDGQVFSTPLVEQDLDSTNPGSLLTVIEPIACKDFVSIVTLDNNYLAMYGCNCNEEGAILIIYNTQFKVTQSKLTFKFFSEGAKLYKVDSNLFLPVGQNLAVVPFRLDVEQLAALVGSHKLIESDDISIVQKVEVANWGVTPKPISEVPNLISKKVEEFLDQGLPENAIFERILDSLIEKIDIDVLYQCVSYFTDIPEPSLVKLLKLTLELDSKSFQGKNSTLDNLPDKLQPEQRTELIDLILTKSLSEVLLLPYLRSQLQVNDALNLLHYICLLLQKGHNLPNFNILETESKLIEWGSVILDANYQKLLMTRDPKVNEILILFSDFVKAELTCLDELSEVAPILEEIKRGKSLEKKTHHVGFSYSIEEVALY